jgi:5-dehydro-2-deoxygluconokinase
MPAPWPPPTPPRRAGGFRAWLQERELLEEKDMGGGRPLDVITIGRSSVDLYGDQVGGRLEDMASFSKYVGGCPANIAIGSARLGLRSAVITRVGDEHMGRFIREQLECEGVDTRGVVTDPRRLTALVILGIRDQHTFPLIFYREDCADAALCEDDIDPAFIAEARAVVVTGTHFSRPNLDAASRKAMRLARGQGALVVLDIDYRPVLWGLTGHGLGEERFVASDNVTAHLQSILEGCDVVVGTEEELHIAGGSTDTLEALRAVRARTGALIVCKRGPMGCVAFPGPIPEDIETGIRGPGFPVEVFNVLGAGDSFMSGFLRGFLRDEPLERSLAYANACGAFAVSRHGCAPAVPSFTELAHFLLHGSRHRRLRLDTALEQLHWATTRTGDWPELYALAIDHRTPFEALGADPARIGRFKRLGLQAAQAGADGPFGVLLDDRLGREALHEAAGLGCWIGRPIERPGTIPLAFEGGPDVGITLHEWPLTHVVKCLVFCHPDDPPELRDAQEQQLLRLAHAARATRHELLLEVIASRSGPVDAGTVPRVLDRLYELGIHPDWWKLEAPPDGGWEALAEVIEARDPHCRGVVVLGLDAPLDELGAQLHEAAAAPVCKGFAVGRTIWGEVARDWIAGRIDDETALARMAGRFRALIDHFREGRGGRR